MKKILFVSFLALGLMTVSCGGEPKLDKTEETAVEDQLKKDQAAMDSLEQAINALMDSSGAVIEDDTL
jgi:hypothetical protein